MQSHKATSSMRIFISLLILLLCALALALPYDDQILDLQYLEVEREPTFPFSTMTQPQLFAKTDDLNHQCDKAEVCFHLTTRDFLNALHYCASAKKRYIISQDCGDNVPCATCVIEGKTQTYCATPGFWDWCHDNRCHC